jgi:hypothetical protein
MEHNRITKAIKELNIPVTFKIETVRDSVKIQLRYQYPNKPLYIQILEIGKHTFTSMTDKLFKEKLQETWIKIKEIASQKSPEIEEHLINGKLISSKRGVRYYFEEEIVPWKIEYTE